MLTLHGIWSLGGDLRLWAEDAELPAAVPARRGRRPKVPRARDHPFACGPQRLRELVGGLGEPTPVTLVLPTGGSGPLASPGLVREPEPDGSSQMAEGLAPWRVPAVALRPADALDLLLGTAGLEEEPGPGLVRTGDSLRFLAEVAGLALALVAAGRILPGLVVEEGGPAARWRPVPRPDDTARLRLLAKAMPAVCRAEQVGDTLEGRRAGAVLGELLDGLVDAAVRSALAGRRLLPARRGRRPGAVPAAEAWLAALTVPDARVEAEPGDAARLARTLEAWRRSALAPAGSLRTCFRLHQPPEDAEGGPGGEVWEAAAASGAEPARWRLEFLLQATDDPSLLVPASQVWKGGRALAPLRRRAPHLQDELLAGLGRASRLYPELERDLRKARPVQQDLDSHGAHRFLGEVAPALDQAGFGVLLPSWWQAPGARLGLRLKAGGGASDRSAVASGQLGLEALCDYRWEVALGDQTVTAEELAELAELKAPLVRLRGQWVELDQRRLRAAMEFLERSGSGRMRAGEVLHTALDPAAVADADTGLPVVGVAAHGWLGDLLSGQAERRVEEVPTPAGFHGALRPYQQRGLSWLKFLDTLGLGACLADDMGLGKTVELLSLLLTENTITPNCRMGPTLLVCPMSVVGNWQREAERFTPGLRVHVHHGSERLGGEALAEVAAGTDLVVTTYSLVARDLEALAAVEWGRVVLDEAQNVKNSAAAQTRAVRSLPARRRIALTGTPVENRLSELWSIMEFLNPGLLGSARGFRSRFAVPVERFGDEEAAARLKRVTGPFILRRLKTDRSVISDLPDKLEMKVFCNLTAEQASLYQAVVDDMLARIAESEGIERRGLVLATMLKLKQVCNHPAHLLGDGSSLAGRSGKLARLEEVLEEVLAEGDKALCFTQFAELGHRLRAHLTERFGREVLFLHGGTSKRQRDEMVARFQDEHGPPLFLLSLKAGGTGLNLTAASHVIHYDRWWNPAVEDQATDRAFRIGQRRDVQVRKLVCAGTVEERVDQMIESKKALAERVVGSGEQWLTELSVAELREVVELSADAVSE